jgi:hypothetical protein
MSGPTPTPPHMIRLTGRQWLAAAFAVVAAVLLFKMMPEKARPVAAKGAPQNECAYNATVEYTRDSLALLNNEIARFTQPPNAPAGLSVASTVARRRLEEQYCLKFATCLLPDATVPLHDMQLASASDSCLRDEALEEYDAVLRE